ncbi:hypothetical protein ACFE04_018530 [Oxalis oulophora]
MGGGRGRNKARTQRKHFKEGRENVWKSDSTTTTTTDNSNNNNGRFDPGWEPFLSNNAAFEEYYKEQGIVTEEEWDTFMDFLRKPLPAAFRINASSQFCSDIRLQLENDFSKSLQGEVIDGDEIEPIRPLPWYPDNLAWHSNFSRKQIRKNENLGRFHEFLKLENEIGNITRQEAVSMIPPLFLDVKPDHYVLDMCAAPGSKTFQLLEIIYQSANPGFLPNGLIVANDLDVQRCNLLIHQTKRICTANLVVTNHEAQHFPSCRPISKIESEPTHSQLTFDCVLCDVPCSGDGTIRKAPDIWRRWNSGTGNGLHSLQILIAMRGLSVLKVGGRMVYSTCSMNPIEDEAVVAEILRRCKGSVELLDVSSRHPQLVRRPGLKKWKVCDKNGWVASYKDVCKLNRNGVLPSMFPSGREGVIDQADDDNKHVSGDYEKMDDGLQPTNDIGSQCESNCLDEEVSNLPLERCMRIMPHDQNGGAFFIAVLHKHSPLPALAPIEKKTRNFKVNARTRNDEPSEALPNQVVEDVIVSDTKSTDGTNEQLQADLIEKEHDGAILKPDACNGSKENNSAEVMTVVDQKAATGNVIRKRHLQTQWKGVDPVVFLKDENVIESIKTFYGLIESFPFEGHLITRNSDTSHVKRIYYISKSIKDILELNLRSGQQLKITSVGLKMFERQTSQEGTSTPCLFRISSEGLPLILPYITKQIIHATLTDFQNLLQYKSIKFANFADPEFGEKASNLEMGCCVVVLKQDEDTNALPDVKNVDYSSTIAIGCWRGKASLCVMVTALDCQELLERLRLRMGLEKEPGKQSCSDEDSTQERLGQIR